MFILLLIVWHIIINLPVGLCASLVAHFCKELFMKSFRVFELNKCRIILISVDFTIVVQYLWLLSHLYWFDPLDLKCVCTNLVFVTRYVRQVNLNRKGIWGHVWQWDIAACSVSFWILMVILCAEKEEEKVPVDDTPCLICHKSTHPDMVSFCVWLSIGKQNSLYRLFYGCFV